MGKSLKNLISVFGEKPARGLPKPTPPPARRLDLATLTRGENAKLSRQSAKSSHPNEMPEWGRGGGILRFLNNSTTEQYFKMLLSHEDVYSFSSPYCIGKLCSSSFYVPGGGKWHLK